ncbi:ATP-dependent metallopeptidase FtsH/Yme1/Tma family protein [Prolixibacteraceae bacterium JC049]|nr:ATP-dependent metallopeptidase FtsH/Yme1/Tma family protein [Prolixibacteraceae bacterium JC049]
MADKNQDNKNMKFPRPKLDPGGKKPKFNPYWIYGVLLVVILALQFIPFSGDPGKINNIQFEEMLNANDIRKIKTITNTKTVEIYLRESSIDKYSDQFKRSFSKPTAVGPHFSFKVPSVDNFDEKLNKRLQELNLSNKVEIDSGDEENLWGNFLVGWGPLILIIVIWVWFFRRMSRGGGGGGAGGIFNVGKSQAKVFDKDSKVSTTFKEVAGLSEAKQEIEEIVEFLKNPAKYTKLGGKIPKGALLVGPPGTGKTLLAKAVAGEADVPFFSMSGSDFVEMFVGVGASRVRDLFKQAKEKSPCIVFIDEIDAIGRARGKNPNMGANDERENTLNQLLTEMDGFDTNSGVIILAATNRADILDRALMRAGRFDRQIHVELPDLNERQAIFGVHLRPLKLDKELDVDFLSKQTPGFSGADIANVCNEAALIAARNNHDAVTKQDFLDAIDRIIGGLEKKNKIISPIEKKTIAYHEAGHAAVGWLLEHAHPLVKVTIVPRGKALGAAWYLPDERSISTKEQMLDEMCATLGGRAAEELIFDKISSGAQNDLERVTKQAYAMVSIYGMSNKVGNVSYYDSTGQADYGFSKPYSEKTAELIDEEAVQLIENAYQRAKDLLSEYAKQHKELADLLLEREVIFSEDLEKIFGPKKGQTREEQILAAKEEKKALEENNNEVAE